jgi:hypothetical protein
MGLAYLYAAEEALSSTACNTTHETQDKDYSKSDVENPTQPLRHQQNRHAHPKQRLWNLQIASEMQIHHPAKGPAF